MYYFSACNRHLFKSYYRYVLFLPFEKFFKQYQKYFLFYLYIFLKKNFLLKEYKKQMCYMVLFISNTFISNVRPKLTKNLSKLYLPKQYPGAIFLLFEIIYSNSSSM